MQNLVLGRMLLPHATLQKSNWWRCHAESGIGGVTHTRALQALDVTAWAEVPLQTNPRRSAWDWAKDGWQAV